MQSIATEHQLCKPLAPGAFAVRPYFKHFPKKAEDVQLAEVQCDLRVASSLSTVHLDCQARQPPSPWKVRRPAYEVKLLDVRVH